MLLLMQEIHHQITVGLADEYPIFSAAFEQFLAHKAPFDIDVKWAVHSGRKLMESLRRDPVQILITELRLSEIDGIDLLEQIKDSYLNTRIIVLTQYENKKYIKLAFSRGTDGYVLKSSSPQDIFQCFSKILQGENYMGENVSMGPKINAPNGSPRSREFDQEDRFVVQSELTIREKEILSQIQDGKSNKQIAAELFISDQTVSVHKRNMMRKFNVHNCKELLEKSRVNNII